jgi:hypothetical protein
MNENETIDPVLAKACGIGQPVPTVKEVYAQGVELFTGYLPNTGTGKFAKTMNPDDKPGTYYECWAMNNRAYFVVNEADGTKVYPQGMLNGMDEPTA